MQQNLQNFHTGCSITYMTPEQLNPLAEIMVSAYFDTWSYRREFLEHYEVPPTLFDKVHHWRSVVQALVTTDDRFTLNRDYAEFGRVHVTDEGGNSYLLRSNGSDSIERAKRQGSLFDLTRFFKSDVMLIVYNFHKEGMDLSVAGTRKSIGKKRLEASGPLTYVGTWPWTTGQRPTPSAFSQGDVDPFGDLGQLPEAEGDAGQ